MRWLICGGWIWDSYEPACARALKALGEEVIRFSWGPTLAHGVMGRIESKFVIAGPKTHYMNRALLAKAADCSPDVVLIWRGVHVLPQTVRSLRTRNCPLLVSYNNDDPFGPLHSSDSVHLRRLWRIFKRAIPEYDVHFVYRESTRRDFLDAGATRVHVLLPYFVPETDMPVHLDFTDLARFECDVVFIGHFERDGRVEYLRALVEAGLHVRLFGTGWDSKKLGNLGQYFGEVTPLRGTEYRKALVASRLALCFLSRLNRDEYTRRCFEIPACGAVLLSERTTALERLFEDGREAVYFSSEVELVGRVKQLLLEPGRLSEIRTAGFERVRRDGHSVYDRMKEMLNIIHMEKLR